ncbi:ROK family protein [Nocardioides nematodiphilus]|uniref:ROK family protein n=1 Tax=Nocardioides nematodiphilus TaxID=2849669 RepID=UPI001CD98BCF|nr:ROK family protein [Nocardioides nematodiphilus]MCA1981495.1 ROK family protein [Nocardioides nematodiphilus]
MSEMATAGELLELVRSGQASTRTDLRRITGLSRTAVVARVSALLDAGLLLVGEELASTGGRPPGALVFNHDAGVVLGVAVGRSRSQLAIFDLQGRELAGDTRDHGVGISAQKLMPMLAERLKTMLAEVTVPVLGIGMSLPGVVDPQRCVSVDSPVMGGWDGVELAPYFAEVADAPLFLANDADVLAYSEMFGPGEKPRNALILKASTGLGLGVIADGQILTGAIGAAGEIGHTRLDAAGDLPCRCGSNGCLETIAAGWAMTAKLVSSGVPAGHVRDLVAAALAGDAVARGLLRESGRHVGELLAIAINLLNPEVVVVGGDMGQAFDLYTAGLRESVYARSTALATRELRFVPSIHGDSSGLVGCAALAIDHILAPGSVDQRLGEISDE